MKRGRMDWKKLGSEVAERYGWQFAGIFLPSNQDATSIMVMVDGPGACKITVSGIEEISLPRKELEALVYERAQALADAAQAVANRSRLII